ncbi:DUF7002 family protein [Streptomyces sp. CA-210063]|uniref:DUF7002 family protein n=1 Tax=Streptomyces sp. CA-210063 TaxID=2801029 RepID=UPI003FA6C0B2
MAEIRRRLGTALRPDRGSRRSSTSECAPGARADCSSPPTTSGQPLYRRAKYECGHAVCPSAPTVRAPFLDCPGPFRTRSCRRTRSAAPEVPRAGPDGRNHPQEYLALLNGRVFFWLTRERLSRLLRARQYRSHPHLVLCLDTAELLRRHGKNVQLAPYNTGSMLRPPPYSPRRGRDVFVDIDEYPYGRWRRQRGPRRDAVVELTVAYAVSDAADLVLRVERWEGGARTEILLER